MAATAAVGLMSAAFLSPARGNDDAQETPTTKPTTGPTSKPARDTGIEIPPKLSPRDINRLKLHELPLDGDPEKVNVTFQKKKGEPAIEDAVRKIIEDGAEVELDWRRILERGRPYEKLQLVLRVSKMQFADRMEVRGDTEKFQIYRRRVMPLVMRGCARSGCHGGTGAAEYFRFPSGAQSSEEFVYTSFHILDRIHTPIGPMLDRDLPEESALLKYMLPKKGEDGSQTLHPPVRNQKINPVIERTDSRQYKDVLEWISSLRVPKPQYDVDYAAPEWLRALSQPPARKEDPPIAESRPAGSQPARP